MPAATHTAWPRVIQYLTPEVYQACVRHISLMSYASGVVAIGVSDTRTKDKLAFGYAGALRRALGDALGCEVAVRVVTDSLAPQELDEQCIVGVHKRSYRRSRTSVASGQPPSPVADRL